MSTTKPTLIFLSLLVFLSLISRSTCLTKKPINTTLQESALQVCQRVFLKQKIDLNGTRYENRRCLVHCYINKHPWTEFLNQNRSCPEDTSGFCDFGVCKHNYVNTLGRVNVTLLGAELDHPAKTLVEVCVHNSSTRIPFYVQEPFNCHHCQTGMPTELTDRPTWNHTCQEVASGMWNLNSRLYFRFFNLTSGESLAAHSNDTLGTYKLSITQMLADLKNGEVRNFPIDHSRTVGHFRVKVNWEPLKETSQKFQDSDPETLSEEISDDYSESFL